MQPTRILAVGDHFVTPRLLTPAIKYAVCKLAPALVYEEPDLLVKVVRDLFTEDFSALVIEGAGAWETVDAYARTCLLRSYLSDQRRAWHRPLPPETAG